MSKKSEPEMVRITLDMPRELLERLDEKAKKEDRSRSAVIRLATLRALAANEKTA